MTDRLSASSVCLTRHDETKMTLLSADRLVRLFVRLSDTTWWWWKQNDILSALSVRPSVWHDMMKNKMTLFVRPSVRLSNMHPSFWLSWARRRGEEPRSRRCGWWPPLPLHPGLQHFAVPSRQHAWSRPIQFASEIEQERKSYNFWTNGATKLELGLK